jgi:hypothetical protein
MWPLFTVMLSTEFPNFHFSGFTEQFSRSKGPPPLCRKKDGDGVVWEQIENTYGLISEALGTVHKG